MFTPTDLYEVFRDTVLPRSGRTPALTRRSLRACRTQSCIVELNVLDLPVIADLRLDDGASVRLYADPREIRRRSLSVTVRIGARLRDGRFHWTPITFEDGEATCDLGAWFTDLAGVPIALCPHRGTQAYEMTPPASSAGDHRSHGSATDEAESRIATAMREADAVARRAMRRHLARIAHPDLAPESERPALDAALGRAFGAIERGRFVIEP